MCTPSAMSMVNVSQGHYSVQEQHDYDFFPLLNTCPDAPVTTSMCTPSALMDVSQGQYSIQEQCYYDFILVPNTFPDAPATINKLQDTPLTKDLTSLLSFNTSPLHQVPEIDIDVITSFLQQETTDHDTQLPTAEPPITCPIQHSPPSLQPSSQSVHQTSSSLQQPHHDLQTASLAVKVAKSSSNRAKHGLKRNEKSPRVKLYEKEKFEDAVKEKRRQDAINSKRNRDRKAAQRLEMKREIQELMDVREKLKWKVNDLRQTEATLRNQLMNRTSASLPPITSPPEHLHVTPSSFTLSPSNTPELMPSLSPGGYAMSTS